jgi:hypothetical protein
LHQDGKTRFIANDHHIRQERDQQGRVGGGETAMPYAHPQVRGPLDTADAKAAVGELRWHHRRLIVRGIDALVDEIAHGRREHEIAGMEGELLLPTKRHAAMAFQDRAVEWLARRTPLDPPGAGTLDQL